MFIPVCYIQDKESQCEEIYRFLRKWNKVYIKDNMLERLLHRFIDREIKRRIEYGVMQENCKINGDILEDNYDFLIDLLERYVGSVETKDYVLGIKIRDGILKGEDNDDE